MNEFRFLTLERKLREAGTVESVAAANYIRKWWFVLALSEAIEWKVAQWIKQEVLRG